MMKTPHPADPRVSADATFAEQEALPFVPMPYRDEADEPAPFRVTARGRRAVIPESLPSLRVVDGSASDDDAGDTRAARARALRRAGISIRDIADQLSVDPLLAQAWTADVPVRGTLASRRRRSSPGRIVASNGVSLPDHRDLRRHAQEDARRRLHEDPLFAVGVGLLSGVTRADAHGLTITSRSAWLLRRVLDWLCEEDVAVHGEARTVLKIGSGVAGDLARTEWAHQLGLQRSQCTVSRWRYARDPEDVEVVIRVADAQLAARYRGWIDALRDVDPATEHNLAQ